LIHSATNPDASQSGKESRKPEGLKNGGFVAL